MDGDEFAQVLKGGGKPALNLFIMTAEAMQQNMERVAFKDWCTAAIHYLPEEDRGVLFSFLFQRLVELKKT